MAVPRGGRDGRAVPRALPERGVTPGELKVLKLVQQGLTNPEIAAQLYVSVRTVETHVASLLTKTGAREPAPAGGRSLAVNRAERVILVRHRNRSQLSWVVGPEASGQPVSSVVRSA